ncbi:hypothetical protein PI125_g21004 [Phytophthora idaei]|nr:hypothetical protein PI125_g21004 [Phytophthora idaei]
MQLHRTCCRRSQPGFIGNDVAAAGARPARCTPTRRAHAVAFGCSVGRDLHSVVARGTARTVNVASDERSRCLESKPGEIPFCVRPSSFQMHIYAVRESCAIRRAVGLKNRTGKF